jgi:hypothetical protein
MCFSEIPTFWLDFIEICWIENPFQFDNLIHLFSDENWIFLVDFDFLGCLIFSKAIIKMFF